MLKSDGKFIIVEFEKLILKVEDREKGLELQ